MHTNTFHYKYNLYEKTHNSKRRKQQVQEFFQNDMFHFSFPIMELPDYQSADHPLFHLIVYKNYVEQLCATSFPASLLCTENPQEIFNQVTDISGDVFDQYIMPILQPTSVSFTFRYIYSQITK